METHQPQHQQAYGYAQQLVETYFRMLTAGCGDKAACTNANCRSNREFKVMSPTDAAIRSIFFATRAPVPLCMPLVPIVAASSIAQSPPSSTLEEEEEEEEEGPETDDVDDQSPMRPSTPRRRLSSAVRLDLNINFTTEVEEDSEEDRDSDLLNALNYRALSTDGRKLSLPKQKLLEAIQKRFPASQAHNQLQR